MTAEEIRDRFLEFFRERDHEVRPSSSLVPADDPTLLFTNAGMVQFKRIFLGHESPDHPRAVTSQKCVRAGGKHNDLEQVGETARHHTFFEMLGNFSFGDYFKRDAIRYAWDFLVDELGLEPRRIWATVHHTDDDAEALWQEVVGLPANRIFRLGDADNFWQMAETGPCGPCSEVLYDLRPAGELDAELSREEFIELSESGEILELWNLVFMQFDRDEEGELHPLPAPSIDTGMGLERLASVIQDVDSAYHTDLFTPLLERVAEVVGRPYEPETEEGVSFRVLADHARAVAFLLADGVFPSNEGRGYVLRRILRRGVRHAWLLGRREPTVVEVVDAVIDEMGSAYPRLVQRRDALRRATRAEEERFLSTIDEGMERFDAVAPELDPGTRAAIDAGDEARPVIPGEDVFRLYDTYGFPRDLTELMARERGYRVDAEGFERALDEQRKRSREAWEEAGAELAAEEWATGWRELEPGADQDFVGYGATEVETGAVAIRTDGERAGIVLRDNPFYAESGGQISDSGEVRGDGWTLRVHDVVETEAGEAVVGELEGELPSDPPGPLPVRAAVARGVRHDTERNHTATHLLHAALRSILGDHVIQRGSLVAPDRLRFDFSHPDPVSPDEVERVESRVNAAVWADHPVETEYRPYDEAIAEGAMALFGEKYGDEVRVVRIPGVSTELCGGTHVSHTGEIGLFIVVTETGVGAGVRRIEALTGPAAFRHLREKEERLHEAADLLKTRPETLLRRIAQVVEERDRLEERVRELRVQGGPGLRVVSEETFDGAVVRAAELEAHDEDEVRAYGDRFRDEAGSGVAVVAARLPEEKRAFFTFVTDDLIQKGVRADAVVREVAAVTGGSGGGRPHMAQAGVGDPGRITAALERSPGIVRELLDGGAEAEGGDGS